jgi:hypothetical protein
MGRDVVMTDNSELVNTKKNPGMSFLPNSSYRRDQKDSSSDKRKNLSGSKNGSRSGEKLINSKHANEHS